MRAGIAVAVISPYNSSIAVAHLLQEVQASFLFISSEKSTRNLAEDACQILAKSKTNYEHVQVMAMPTFDDIIVPNPSLKLTSGSFASASAWTAHFIHFSGSTSLPKPLPWSHNFFIQVSWAPLSGHYNFSNQLFAWHCVSMSHGTGAHLLPWIASSGFSVATFPPQTPALLPSPDTTWKGFLQSSPDYLQWALDSHKVEKLKAVKGIIFVGSFLNSEIGYELATQGLKLFPLYGMAEAGVLGSFLPPAQGLEWEYFTMTPRSGGVFHPTEEDGIYELILVESPNRPLAMTNTQYQESKAYATKDLFTKHPVKKGFWKPLGRKDHLLLLSNGKKVNPIPMEDILNSNPRINNALVFGNGRNRAGALIELSDALNQDPVNSVHVAVRDFIENKVNPVVSRHAKIYPEMVLFTDPSRPFQFTEKGTVRRPLVLEAYRDDINALYERPSGILPPNLALPQSWDATTSFQFASGAIQYVLPGISDSDDIFHFGSDSLQAMRIESIVREAFRKTGIAFDDGNDIIYGHPSVVALGEFIFTQAVSGRGVPTDEAGNPKVDLYHVLSRYTSAIRVVPVSSSEKASLVSARDGVVDDGHVVLITGTTGRLGVNTLHQLICDDKVKFIYALNRFRPGEDPSVRQKKVLLEHGLDPSICHSPRVRIISGDLREPNFGLDEVAFSEIRTCVTHFVHLAWPVDWKMSLRSFDGMLSGVVNLVNAALAFNNARIPRILFASSIGVFNNPEEGFVIPEGPLEDLNAASGRGYSEAKAIAEEILLTAAKSSLLRPLIIRIGQIAGSPNGTWKTTEWVPALIKSSVTVGGLPFTPHDASWIPASLAGRAIADLLNQESTTSPVVNLVHPKPLPVSHLMQVIGRQLRVPLIPYQEWLSRIEATDLSRMELDQVPALKMMDFYQRHGLRDMKISDMICRELSPSLRSAAEIDDDEIINWVSYWRGSGLL
ncbi:hypothetical protein ONZ45_g5549 [Pleurotus djamor]|nr:hypothetical protein ONZ45_g5549 [Pleurotus djamor]